MPAVIDWSAHDKYSENTIECRCGAIYRSHSKAVLGPPIRIVTRKPCPSCGESDGNARRASSDPEEYVIGVEKKE